MFLTQTPLEYQAEISESALLFVLLAALTVCNKETPEHCVFRKGKDMRAVISGTIAE